MSDTVTRAEYDALKAESARLTAELDDARAAFAHVSSIDWSTGNPLDLSFKGDGVKLFAAAMCDWFRDAGGENYVSARCTDPRDGVSYEITMRREGGKLPAELADELRADRDALLRAAERLHEALGHFGEHDRDCARKRFEGGRPKEGGGYEMMYAGVWYEAKPVDRTPKCDCGLDDACSPDFLSRVEPGEWNRRDK